MSLGVQEPNSPGFNETPIVKREAVKYDFKIRNLERQVADEHAARVRLENKLAQLMAEKDSLESDSTTMYEKMLAEQQELEHKVKFYEGEIAKSTEQSSQFSRELNTIKADLVDKDMELSSARLQIKAIQDQMSSLEHDRETDRMEADKNMQILRIDRDASVAETESLRAQLDRQRQQSDSNELVSGQLSEYVAKTRELEDELTATRKAAHQGQLAKDLNMFLEEEKAQLKREVETLQATAKENCALQEKLARLEAEKEIWAVYIRSHPDLSSPQDLAKRVSQLTMENRALSAKAEKLERDNEQSAKTVFNESLTRKQIELEDVQDQLGETKTKLMRREFEVENLRKEVALLEAHIDRGAADGDTQAQLQQASETIAALQAQVAELEKDRTEAAGGTVLKKRRVSEMMLSSRKDNDEKLRQVEKDLEEKAKQLELAKLDAESSKKTIEQLQLAVKESATKTVEVKGSPFEVEIAPRLAKLTALEREVEDLRKAVEENSVPEYVPRSSLLTLKVEYDILKDRKQQLEMKQQSFQKALSIREARLHKATSQLFGYHLELLNDRTCLLKPIYNADVVFEAQFDAIDRTYKNFRVTDDLRKYEALYKYWVQERKCLPGFLGAAVLEMVEQSGP